MEYAEAELARYEVERERMGAQGIELPVAPPMPHRWPSTERPSRRTSHC